MEDWKSAEIDKVTAALFAAKIDNPTKNATNPHHKNRYADLGAILDACLAPLAEAGILVKQIPGWNADRATMTTILFHVPSQQWLRCTAEAPLQKPDSQGVGSAFTYLRRYGLTSLLNLWAEDDDGNRAGRSRDDERKPPQSVAPKATEKTGTAPNAVVEEFIKEIAIAPDENAIKRILLAASKVTSKGTPERERIRDATNKRNAILNSNNHDPQTGEVLAGGGVQ